MKPAFSIKQIFMERINFMEAKMDDIIFHNRNKAYGAYVLRTDYNKHLRKAMFMGYSFFASLLLLPALERLLDKPDATPAIEQVFNPRLIEQIVEMVQPTPKADMPKPSTGNTQHSSGFSVVRNPAGEAQDSMPPLAQAAAIEGVPSEGGVDVFVIGGTGTIPEIPEPAPPAPNQVVDIADEMPEYIGGEAAMKRFLSENIEYPERAKMTDIEGKVVVGFVVNSDGTVVDAKVLKGIGGGCNEEALRVVSMMPKFKPGRQGGRNVRVRFVLPIAFRLN
jgi:protein TonB